MKFDKKGKLFPRISKAEIQLAISENRSKMITENYKCKCGGSLQVVCTEDEFNVICKSCEKITDNKTLRKWIRYVR